MHDASGTGRHAVPESHRTCAVLHAVQEFVRRAFAPPSYRPCSTWRLFRCLFSRRQYGMRNLALRMQFSLRSGPYRARSRIWRFIHLQSFVSSSHGDHTYGVSIECVNINDLKWRDRSTPRTRRPRNTAKLPNSRVIAVDADAPLISGAWTVLVVALIT
jgi:hypothetical protein